MDILKKNLGFSSENAFENSVIQEAMVNQDEYNDFRITLEFGLKKYKLHSKAGLPEEISKRKERLAQYEEGDNIKIVEEEMTIRELEFLWSISKKNQRFEEERSKKGDVTYKKTHHKNPIQKKALESDEKKLETLRQQSKENLELRLEDTNELSDEVEGTQRDIENLEKLGSPSEADEEKDFHSFEPLFQNYELQDSDDTSTEIVELKSKIKYSEIKKTTKVCLVCQKEPDRLCSICQEQNARSSQSSQTASVEEFPNLESSNVLEKKDNQIDDNIQDQLLSTNEHERPLDQEEYEEERALSEESSFLYIKSSEEDASQADEPFRNHNSPNESPLKLKDSAFLSNRNKEEYIVGLLKDISEIPICAEKCILNIILLTISRESGEDEIEKARLPLPKYSNDTFQQELQLLKDRLEIEGLESAKVKQSRRTIQIKVKVEDWRAVLAELQNLFRIIKPLDIQELFRLITQVDEAVESVKDQEMILFLGGTGTGKSAIVHFCAGSKKENPEMEGLKDIELKVSETRRLVSVPVNIHEVGGYSAGSVILCDSPGLDDTAGPEVDIANGIGIMRAARKCKAVKPVILVSYSSEDDQLSGLKNLARRLASMIPGVDEHLRSFTYIFTKYPSDETVRIHTKLNELGGMLTAEETSDKRFMGIFNDILRKTKKEVMAINPCADGPGEILDKLVESNFISNPFNVFKFSITDKSRKIIQDQLEKHRSSIKAGVKRSDCGYVKYKLDELKDLAELLKLESINQVYSECVASAILHLNKECQDSIDTLNKCLKDGNELTSEDVKSYRESIDRIKDSDDLRTVHLGENAIHWSAFLQNILSQIEIWLPNIQEMDLSDVLLKSNLDKIKLLCQSFPEIENKYENIDLILKAKFDFLIESIENAIDFE